MTTTKTKRKRSDAMAADLAVCRLLEEANSLTTAMVAQGVGWEGGSGLARARRSLARLKEEGKAVCSRGVWRVTVPQDPDVAMERVRAMVLASDLGVTDVHFSGGTVLLPMKSALLVLDLAWAHVQALQAAAAHAEPLPLPSCSPTK